MDTYPPSEAYHYGCINWKLAQVKEPLWSGFQSLTSVRCSKANLANSLMLKCGLCHVLEVHLQQEASLQTLALRTVRMGGTHPVMDLAVQHNVRRKEAVG